LLIPTSLAQYLPSLVAAMAGLAVLSLAVGLYRLLKPAGELEGRLESSVTRRAANGATDDGSSFFQHWASLFKGTALDEKMAGKMAATLEQADMAMTVNEYVLIRVGGAVLGALLGFIIMRNILVALGLAVAALQIPVFIVHGRSKKRQQRFQSQLVDVITMLSSGLKAGVGLMQAMDLVRREMPSPASDEFGRVVREVSLGASLDEALTHLVERMPGDDLGMLVAVINIQSEVGGNLVTILETVVTTIRERLRVAQEIRTLTAQQRMTGYVLAGLPFLVGGAVFVINPEYMQPLFSPKWIWMPGGAIVMMVIGFVIIQKIVDIKV
jgi:tight adherence protein B